MANPLIRPKPTPLKTDNMRKSAGILDDFSIRKNVNTQEGTIEKTPVNSNDIVNKAYADSVGGGAPEGTAVLSTGEAGGTKFLREDGDGTCSWQAGGSGDALVANPLSQFAATTSAQLAGVLSDETGSGAAVFATSPTLVTPILGTPTSGTLTNCTGLPAASVVAGSLVAGMVASDHGTATTDELVNVCYGTSATPPTASTTTEGSLYIQYTA